MMRFLTFILTGAAVFAQPSNLTSNIRSVSVNSNGVVIAPANLFAANSNGLNAVISSNLNQQKVWLRVATTNNSVVSSVTLWPGSNITLSTTNTSTNIDISISSSGSGGGLSDGDYGDITVGGGGATLTLDNSTVTSAKIADGTITTVDLADDSVTVGKLVNLATDSILGRATTGTGDPEVLTALPWPDTGDVTRAADSTSTTIANNAVTTPKLNDSSVTLPKLANIADGTVLGNSSGSSTAPSALSTLPNGVQDNITRLGSVVSGSLDAARITTGTLPVVRGGTGAGTLTGLIKGNGTSPFTAAVAGTDYQSVITIQEADGTPSVSPVTTIKVSNGTLTDNGSGTVTISTGGGGGSLSDGDYGDITVGGSGTTMTIDNGAVTKAKFEDVAASKILGRNSSGSGAPQEISLGNNLSMTSTTLNGFTLPGVMVANPSPYGPLLINRVPFATDNTGTNFGFKTFTGVNTSAVVYQDSPEIFTPTIADFTNSPHTHEDAAGGGTLDADAIASGTLAAGRMPAFTGDVTTSAGSVSTTIANNAVTTAKIADGQVTKAKIENISASKLLGRGDSGSGAPQELTVGTGLSVSGTTMNSLRTSKVITSDQSVTSSTTLTDVTGLGVAIEASKKYHFYAYLPYNEAGTAGGLKLAINGPSSPTTVIYTSHIEVSSVSVTSAFTAFAGAHGVAVSVAGTRGAWIEGTVVNGSNAGTLIPQFAQNTSDASATSIKAGAYFFVDEIP